MFMTPTIFRRAEVIGTGSEFYMIGKAQTDIQPGNIRKDPAFISHSERCSMTQATIVTMAMHGSSRAMPTIGRADASKIFPATIPIALQAHRRAAAFLYRS